MTHAKHVVFRKGIHLVATAAMLMVGQVATAANVTVRVVDVDTQQPISGAAVCLGSAHVSNLHGAKKTNDAGEVVYAKAPKADFVLSVSANGQSGYREEKISRDFDITYTVEMRRGEHVSTCLAPVIQDKTWGKEALSLVSVDVRSYNLSGETVDISTRVEGLVPTHIRASTRANFQGARWLPYRRVTRHSIDGPYSSQNLYVQVKRLLASDASSVEAVSVARVSEL